MNVRKSNQITPKDKKHQFLRIITFCFILHKPKTTKSKYLNFTKRNKNPKTLERHHVYLLFHAIPNFITQNQENTSSKFSIYFGGVKNSTDLDSNYRLFGEEPTPYSFGYASRLAYGNK